MPFFDLPSYDELTPEVRQMLDDYQRLTGTPEITPTWKTFGRHPRIIEARFRAFENLNYIGSFSWQARMVAVMLIAHAKRCRGASRAPVCTSTSSASTRPHSTACARIPRRCP